MYVLNTYSYSSHIRSSDFPQQAKIVRCYVENSSYTGVLIYLAGFLITLSPNGPFASNSFFSTKNYLQSSRYHVKTESAAIFFFFSSFPSPRSFFFSFLFLRYCDFGASRAWESCLLTPFHSNYCKLRWVGFQKIGYIYMVLNPRFLTSKFAFTSFESRE